MRKTNDDEIGDIKIEKHSSLIKELKQDILNGGEIYFLKKEPI